MIYEINKVLELHPLARAVLSSPEEYMFSTPLCRALAQRSPKRCLEWSLELIVWRVMNSPPQAVIGRIRDVIPAATTSPSERVLEQLATLIDEAWRCGLGDASVPYLNRAVARLGWAAICFVYHATNSRFKSRFFAPAAAKDDWGRELANQCAMALDMTYTDTQDGRLMVAASFSREMSLPTEPVNESTNVRGHLSQ